MNDPYRRCFLFTALVAVLCTIVCPFGRADSLPLFTTTVSGQDARKGFDTIGPVPGELSVAVSHSGDVYDPKTGALASYAFEADVQSTIVGKLFSSGEIEVGKLWSSAGVEGHDGMLVSSDVTFAMTITADPGAPAASSIPIFMYAPLSADCKISGRKSELPAECEANASATITDNTTGVSQSSTLPVSGYQSASSYPAFEIDAHVGDTITINLDTALGIHGHYWICQNPDGSLYDCKNVGAEATVSVDPYFGLNQADSQYYGLSFSPNVAISPTPEPSALILFGTNLLILAPVLRRRFGSPRR